MARDTAHYYRLLGLEPDASRDAVKKAFRGLAQELHPDVSDDPGAIDRFREIVEAYEALSRPLRRELRGRSRTRAATVRRRSEPRPPAGGEVAIDYLTATRGARLGTELLVDRTCGTCSGEGRAPWARPSRCGGCDGDGWVRAVSTSERGRWIQVDACPECAGAGVVVSDPCPTCAGTGTVAEARRAEVVVPAGVRDGAAVIVPGAGHVDSSGVAADAVVRVRVRPPPDATLVRVVALAGIALGLVLLVVMLRAF